MHALARPLPEPLPRKHHRRDPHHVAQISQRQTQRPHPEPPPPAAEIQITDQQRQRRQRHQRPHPGTSRRHVVLVTPVRREQLRPVAHHREARHMRQSRRRLDHPQPQPKTRRIEHVHRHREEHKRQRKRRRPPPPPPAREHQHAPRKHQQPHDRNPRLLRHKSRRVQRQPAEHRRRCARHPSPLAPRPAPRAHLAREQPPRDPQNQHPVLRLRIRIEPLKPPPIKQRRRVDIPAVRIPKKLKHRRPRNRARRRRVNPAPSRRTAGVRTFAAHRRASNIAKIAPTRSRANTA